MIDKIKALIEEYTDTLNTLEEDRRNEGISISNAYRTAKIGVYASVIEDLKEIVESEEK